MAKREYKLALFKECAEAIRAGHIITLRKPGLPDTDIALYSAAGGWHVDHPRTGYSIRNLDQVALTGRVTLPEAKERILSEINAGGWHKRIADRAAELTTLNPNFN